MATLGTHEYRNEIDTRTNILQTIYISTCVFVLYTVVVLFVVIFQCGDPSKLPILHLQGACLQWSIFGPINYIQGVMTVLVDGLLAILPIFIMRHHSMAFSWKLSVYLILMLATVSGIVSIVRLGFIGAFQLNTKSDEYFTKAAGISICSTVELGLAIIAGSLATLRPLFRAVSEKIDRRRVYPSYCLSELPSG